MCGIEYGDKETRDSLVFGEEPAPNVWTSSDDVLTSNLQLAERYNQRVAKVLTALSGESVSNYREFYRRHSCFAEGSGYFKLNLYPLAFPSIKAPKEWEWREEATGLQNYDGYA